MRESAGEERHRQERRALRLGLALALAWAVGALVVVHPEIVGAYQDDGIYLATARSLAEGTGYRLVNLPGEPSQTKYPPLWPLVLAGVWRLWPAFPDNVLAFKALGVGCAALTALAAQRLALRQAGLSPLAGLAVLALSLGSMRLVAGLNYPLSEPLFALLASCALLWLEPAGAATAGLRRPGARAVAAGALAVGLACLVRAQGAAIAVAALAALALARRWRAAAAVAAAASVALGGWAAWSRAHRLPAPALVQPYLSYEGFVGGDASGLTGADAVAIVLRHLREIPTAFGDLLGPATPAANLARGVVLLGLALPGAVSLWRRGRRMLVLQVGGTLALLALVPWAPDRYVLPILGPFAVLLVAGVVRLCERRTRAGVPGFRRVPVWVAAGAIVAQASAIGVDVAHADRDSLPRPDSLSTGAGEWPALRDATRWARAHVPPDESIGAADDALWHLYTGRRAVRFWPFRPAAHWRALAHGRPAPIGEPAELLAELDRVDVRWLVLEPGALGLVPGGEAATRVGAALVELPEAGAHLAYASPNGLVEIWRLHAAREPAPQAPVGAASSAVAAPVSGGSVQRPASHQAPPASSSPG